MLTFESPVYLIDDIVVFRDHALPGSFYYLHGSPHITKVNGQPVFMLLTYRNAVGGVAVAPVTRDQLGGAFLTFEVDCGLSVTQLATIQGELSALVPPGTADVNLTPVLYTSGTAHVIALDYQEPQEPAPGLPLPVAPPVPPASMPTVSGLGAAVAASVATVPPPSAAAQADAANRQFVRGIIGSTTPSLLQDLQASFSLSLTPDAAALLEAAYTDDLSPIGVMYELQFTGLRPALSVKAHGEKKKIYEHLQMAFHAGYTSGTAAAQGGNQQQQPLAKAAPPPNKVQRVQGQQQQQQQPAGGIQGQQQAPPVQGQQPVPPVQGQQPVPPVQGQQPAAPAQGQPAPPPAQGQQQPAAGGIQGQQQQQPAVGGLGAAKQTGTGTGTGTGTQNKQDTSTQVALSVDIGYEVEKMVQDSTITIDIVRQRDDQSMDQLQTQALDLIKQLITEEFFKPQMTTASAGAAATAATAARQFSGATAPAGGMNRGAAGQGGRVEVGFQLQYKEQNELDTFDVDFNVAAPETRTHAPNGFFSALLTDVDKATHIVEVDLDSEFFKQIDVTVTSTADLDRFDIQAIDVELQHGGTTDTPATAGSIQFTPQKLVGGHFIAFPDAGDYTVRHRTVYSFGNSPDIAAQTNTTRRSTPWISSPDRALLVHPGDDVAIRSVYVEPGAVDWDVVGQVETTLTYADPANSFTTSRTYLVNATTPRQEWRVRLTDPDLTSYQIGHTWHLKEGHKVVPGPTVDSNLDHVYVPDPFVDRLEVVVNGLVDKTTVARIDVEFTYTDKDNDFEVQKIVQLAGPDFAPTVVEVPLMDADVREYTYQATLVKVNGAPEQQAAQTTDAGAVFISEGGHYLDVNITILGQLASAGLDGILVELRADPPDGQQQVVQSVAIAATDPPKATLRLLLRSDRADGYEFRTTAYLTAGTQVVRDWESAQAANLVLQPARLVTPS